MSSDSIMPYSSAPVSEAAAKPSQKRKNHQISNSIVASESMTDDGWKKIDMNDMNLEGFQDGCAFELEELTDYRVEETEDGKRMLVVAKTRRPEKVSEAKRKREKLKTKMQHLETEQKVDDDVRKKMETPAQEKQKDQQNISKAAKKVKTIVGKVKVKERPVETMAVDSVDLPEWKKFKLHPLLLQSLEMCGFSSPTRIQERTLLPALLDNRDVVGAAPTGSGKTLAFGLPILSQLLNEREKPGYRKDCKALILTPTRELALQIQHHLEKMVHHREIGVVTLVGGMSVQKQRRILSYRPEIVIGTPGRLWDIIENNHEHMKSLAKSLRFLVVDEADRMLQAGLYPELEKIIHVLRQKRKGTALELSNLSDDDDEENDLNRSENDDIKISDIASRTKVMMPDDVLQIQLQHSVKKKERKEIATASASLETASNLRHVRQTFLFSATLMIPEGGRSRKRKKFCNALSVLEQVMKRVGLRGKPAIVDLSASEPEMNISGIKPIVSEELQQKVKIQQDNVALSLPAGLELCQYEVTESTRDSYLYYFLTQYPCRTIIFLNAIHQVRKLASLLNLLNLPVFALHAEMQQRQRLKKLDGFRAHKRGILVATDVAARGLDIPSVDYVVHYHIARSTEVFVHRSGRTARANREGLSIALVSPADARYHSQICKMLQRPTGLSNFPFDHRYMEAIDGRMRLAKRINEHENAAGKLKSEALWFKQMAAASELDMDDDLVFELNAKQQNLEKRKNSQHASVESLRAQLKRLLAVPLRPVGSARKFRQLHKEFGSEVSVDGEYCTRDASIDLALKGTKPYKRFRRRK
ncbi:hypothetical protein PsorP6_000200 [Peronosclerospora sorghi]|uniref:Uncharacterized protein n=1 Tax=Peronosclerospora sorghi TaxID=230839 RepID=A0ACC0WVU2_9STRA|nr:hypothetical protein PsorP6_000200 [Peronosclerospora sorghi]